MFDNYYLDRYVTIAPYDPVYYRHSNAYFCKCADGRLLASYATGRVSVEFEKNMGKFSLDEGLTWGDEFLLHNFPDQYDFNGMLISHGTRIILVLLDWRGYPPCDVVMKHSDDYCQTWSSLTKLTGKSTYQLFGMNYIKMGDGTHILTGSYDPSVPSGLWTSHIWRCPADKDPSNVVNWVIGGDVPKGGASHLDEPCVVELSDGNLFMLMRTPNGVLYQSESGDKGDTWSTAVPSGLVSSPAPANLLRLSFDPNRVVVTWNNSPTKRYPLVVALSEDDCQTWSTPSIIANKGYNTTYPTLQNRLDGGFIVSWWDQQSVMHEIVESAIVLSRVEVPPIVGKGMISYEPIRRNIINQPIIL